MSSVRLQVVDPEGRFTCNGCTNCCTQPYAVVIEKAKAEVLVRHDFSRYPQLVGVPLFYQSRDVPPGYYVLSKRSGTTRCVFLADDGLCLIHKELGAGAKPDPCLKFPFRLSSTHVDHRISLDYGCPTVQASKGRALLEQADRIAGIYGVSKDRVQADAAIALTGNVHLLQSEYDALMDRMEVLFSAASDDSIWDRFAAAVLLLQAVATQKRIGGTELVARLRNAEPLAGSTPVPSVQPYDSPAGAPGAVRMLFAAGLLRDTLPPEVSLNISLWGRIKLLPKLASLAKMAGRYHSRFLRREIDVGSVTAYPLEPSLEPAATRLLRRYFRARIWQRFIMGTRLSVVAGLHQHIHDLNAVIFLARAEAEQRRAERLSERLVGEALSHIEFNVANQPRVFDQKTLGWFTAGLDDAGLALESLRLMALPGRASAAAT